MARTNLPLTTLVANSGITYPNGTPIDQANGMTIPAATTAYPSEPHLNNLMLVVRLTNGADKLVTMRAGSAVSPATITPGTRSGIGDATFTATAASGGALLGPFDPSRFMNSDGTFYIDFASGATGYVTAIMMPERF